MQGKRGQKTSNAETQESRSLGSSVSPKTTTNVFVRKKDEDTRVTFNFRRLSYLTVTEFYSMDNMWETLEEPGNKRIFKFFNLKDEHFQVRLYSASKNCTTIRKVFSLLQYERLPKRLHTSFGMFQRSLNTVSRERKGVRVLAFLENKSAEIIPKEEHPVPLAAMSDIRLQKEVELKLPRCSFGVRTAKTFSQGVDYTGLRPSDKHIVSDRKLTEPASGTDVTRFSDLADSFAAFLDQFAWMAALLHEVLKKKRFTKKKRHGQPLNIPDWNRM